MNALVYDIDQGIPGNNESFSKWRTKFSIKKQIFKYYSRGLSSPQKPFNSEEFSIIS